MNPLKLRRSLPESGDGLIGFQRTRAEIDRDVLLRDKELELKDIEIRNAKRKARREKWNYWRSRGFLGGEALLILLAGIAIGFVLGFIFRPMLIGR